MPTDLMEAPPVCGIDKETKGDAARYRSHTHDLVLLETRVIKGMVQYTIMMPDKLNQGRAAEGHIYLTSFRPKRGYSLIIEGMVALDNTDDIYYSYLVKNVKVYTNPQRLICSKGEACSPRVLQPLNEFEWLFVGYSGDESKSNIRVVLPGMRQCKPFSIKQIDCEDLASKILQFALQNRTCVLSVGQNPAEVPLIKGIYGKLSQIFASDNDGYMPFDRKRLPQFRINEVPNFDDLTLYGFSDSSWFKRPIE